MEVLLDEFAQDALIHRIEAADGHHLAVAARLEHALLVEHVRDPVRHPGREIPAHATQDDHHATGHVLAAVVAGALDHRDGAGVPDGEPVAGGACREQPA